MKIDRRFPLHVAIALTAGLVVAAIPVLSWGSAGMFLAIVVGALLSTLNVLAGFLAIEYAMEKSHETFLKAVLGGMGLRMAVMLGLLVLLIKLGGLHTVALVGSTLGFYAVYLVLELVYIQRKVSQK